MSFIKSCLFTFTLAVILVLCKGQIGLDENCLGCLCEGSSGCNVTLGCNTPYPGGYFCGPFRISYAYWSDAGKPVLGNDDPERKGAFENCVIDLQCAAQTVRGYMAKFSQDCNNDARIDCDDYIRIHGLGGYGCRDPSFVAKEFYQKYRACMRVVEAASRPLIDVRTNTHQ